MHTETFVDGVWYPSVTTILGVQSKPWLEQWRQKWGPLAERKTEIASTIGTAFHNCVEQYLNTGTFTVNMLLYPSCAPRVVGMMRSWINWASGVDGTLDYTEVKVISREYTYSGTFDAIGKIGKVYMALDWKTSSRIYPEMALQLAAYAQASNEMRETKEWVQRYPESGHTVRFIKDGMIVHVSKEKPDFKVTTKQFKLGKRVLGRFLKLRSMFDDIQGGQNAEINVTQEANSQATQSVHSGKQEDRSSDQS